MLERGKKKKKEYICIKRRTKRKRKWGALSCPMERRHDKCTESDFRNCLKSLSRVVRNSPGIHGECVTAKSHAELCSPQSCLPVPCLERLQSRTDPSQLQSLSLSLSLSPAPQSLVIRLCILATKSSLAEKLTHLRLQTRHPLNGRWGRGG